MALSVVAELKLFWLVMVIVLVPLLPWFTVSEAGEAPTVKPGTGAEVTVNETVAVWVMLSPLPLMVMV